MDVLRTGLVVENGVTAGDRCMGREVVPVKLAALVMGGRPGRIDVGFVQWSAMRFAKWVVVGVALFSIGYGCGRHESADDAAKTLVEAFVKNDQATVERLVPADLPILRDGVSKARHPDVVYFGLMICDLSRNHHRDAVDDIGSACRLKPDDETYAYYQSLALQMNRQPAASRDAIVKLRERFSDTSVATTTMLAMEDMGLQRYDEAQNRRFATWHRRKLTPRFRFGYTRYTASRC